MAEVWPDVRQEGDAYRRIELITGRRRWQAWSGEQKARILAESAEPGANISEVARRNGVNRGLLTLWRRMAGLGSQVGAAPKSDDDGPLFVPVSWDRGPVRRLWPARSRPGGSRWSFGPAGWCYRACSTRALRRL